MIKSKKHKGSTKKDFETFDYSQLNMELEVQAEYLKQVIKSLSHDNKRKDFKIKGLLNENVELK